MVTWKRGRQILLERLRTAAWPLGSFLQSLFVSPPQRVQGTGVFLTSAPDATPHALMHSLKHYKVLHAQNVFLTVDFRDEPWVADEERTSCESLGHDCWRVIVRYGFMDRPEVALALQSCARQGLELDPMDVSYFLSRETIVPVEGGEGMALWRERIFAALARNSGSVSDFFNIPTNRVVELGTQVEI